MPDYLIHFNKNHDKLGQFTFGDGDGDGKREYHSRYKENKREMRNKNKISKEIAFQNRKIEDLKKRKKAYDDSIVDIKKDGYNILVERGYSPKHAKEAVEQVIKRRQTESDWIDYQIKNLEKYNRTIADLDVSNINSFQVERLYREYGKKTLAEINKFDELYKGKTLNVQ